MNDPPAVDGDSEKGSTAKRGKRTIETRRNRQTRRFSLSMFQKLASTAVKSRYANAGGGFDDRMKYGKPRSAITNARLPVVGAGNINPR